jgi:hypothetical protein
METQFCLLGSLFVFYKKLVRHLIKCLNVAFIAILINFSLFGVI